MKPKKQSSKKKSILTNPEGRPVPFTQEEHDKIMTELPIYCKKHPEDDKAMALLFEHTYCHLHSYIYQDLKYNITQDDYMQECFLYFKQRLNSYDPKRSKNKKGWFGRIRYIKMDAERQLLKAWEKHKKNNVNIDDFNNDAPPSNTSDTCYGLGGDGGSTFHGTPKELIVYPDFDQFPLSDL